MFTPKRPKKTAASRPVSDPARAGLETDDFYLTPEGFMVFTAAYHLKRGYCCQNKCRHCPYDVKKSEA